MPTISHLPLSFPLLLLLFDCFHSLCFSSYLSCTDENLLKYVCIQDLKDGADVLGKNKPQRLVGLGD